MPAPMSSSTLALLVALAAAHSVSAQATPPTDWSAVERALGRKGAMQPGDVFKFGFPRGDLQVTAAGVSLKPTFALGSWVAFKHSGTETVAMGDLVLTEAEVGPVMAKLQEGQVQQTALHNHLLGELPRVMYMHIEARGEAAKIATAVHAALALTGTPMGAPPQPATAPPVELDTAAIARALGTAGKMNGGVYQVSMARAGKVMEHDMEVPPSMGVATAINFQPTGAGKAAITGDFVITENEVNPVIRALTSHGIAVTAVHSHMLHETPRLFFIHFWGNAEALTLALGLRTALDAAR